MLAGQKPVKTGSAVCPQWHSVRSVNGSQKSSMSALETDAGHGGDSGLLFLLSG